MTVAVRLLGNVDVTADGGESIALSRKERALVAALGVHAGESVSEGRLIDVLWGDEPPPSATKTLRSYVSRIRRALGPAGVAVVVDGSGYRLDARLIELDVAVVGELVQAAAASTAAGEHARSADLYREALSHWRGASLGDLATEPWAVSASAHLDETRMAAVEARVDADLACGRHLSLVGELESLTAMYPSREHLWAARVIALYRSGRQADALRVFADLRRLLADELGLDPSPDLCALERRVLDHDPSLSLSLSEEQGRVDSGASTVAPAGLVTFLLTDVVGSTRLWEEHPRAMADAVARHDVIVAAAVAAAGGTLLKHRGEGDSTFSVFPRTSDAAVAALDIVATLRATAWAEDIEVTLRAAIHVGQSVERDGDFYGPAVNRTARLRSIASPGQVLLSRPAAEVLTDDGTGAWALLELGERQLKDLARPETVYALVEPSEPGEPGEPGEPSEPTRHAAAAAPLSRLPLPRPLAERGTDAVRTEELAALGEAWKAVSAGARRAVFVGGEPGIGKTWLVAALAKAAHGDGATVLLGRCDDDIALPYGPFTEALGPVVAGMGSSLASRVSRAGELVRLLPDLGSMVAGLPDPLRADPEAERWSLFEAVDELLAAAGTEGPLVLVLDDIHWAATPTLLLLRHVLRSERDHRLLVIATYRHTELSRSHPLAEMLADLRREAVVERLMLDGLDDAGVAAMAEALAGQRLDEEAGPLIAAVHRETGGNPFFVDEVLRHLAEIGALARGADGRWQTATAIDDMRLPESIRDVVTRRLSRLSDAANRALTYAAVLGPEFTLRVLEAIPQAGSEGADLLVSLEEATTAGLLVEAPAGFAFAHALIRQALLDELSAPRRMRAHRQIAESIEQLTDHAEHIDLLAHHFAEAALDGQTSKAADYALAAGTAALRAAAHDHALAVLRRGLDALDLAAEADPLRRAQILTELAWAMSGCEDVGRQEMIDVANAALAAARESGCDETLLQAVEVRTDLYRVSTFQPELAPLFTELLAGQDELDDRLRARLLAAYAAWLSGESLGEVDDIADASIAITDALGEIPLERALRAKLTAAWWLPDPARIRELGDQLIRSENLFRFDTGVFAHGTAALLEGDGAEFERVVDELDEVATRTRGWSVRYNALASRITLCMLRGQWADATRLLEAFAAHGGDDIDAINVWSAQQIILHRDTVGLDALIPTIAAAADASPELAGFRCGLALAHAEAGEHDTAAAMVGDLAPRLSSLRRDQTWPIAVWALGAAAVRAGVSPAATTIRDLLAPYTGLVIANAAATFAPGLADDVLCGLERVLGNHDAALTHGHRAIDCANRLRSDPLLARAQLALGQALRAAGQDDDARTTLNAARDLAAATGMPPVAADAEAELKTL